MTEKQIRKAIIGKQLTRTCGHTTVLDITVTGFDYDGVNITIKGLDKHFRTQTCRLACGALERLVKQGKSVGPIYVTEIK